MEAPVHSGQRWRGLTLQEPLQHSQTQLTAFVGLALTPVQQDPATSGRGCSRQAGIEVRDADAAGQGRMQLRFRQTAGGAEGGVAGRQLAGASGQPQLVATAPHRQSQGRQGGAADGCRRLALGLQLVLALAVEQFTGGEHQAEQQPRRRLALQQLGQGNQLKGQQAVGEPGFYGCAGGDDRLQLLAQQASLVQATGQIAPVAWIDVAGIAQQRPQAGQAGCEAWIRGDIRPKFRLPAGLPQRRQQQPVDIGMMPQAVAQARIEQHQPPRWAHRVKARRMAPMQAHDPFTPLATIPEDWAMAALAGRRERIEQIVAAERGGGDWNAMRALRCAHLWLAAGLEEWGDQLVLEADDLAPQARLIPDWWGLWPAGAAQQPGRGMAEPLLEQAQALAGLYLEWRHQRPQQLLIAWGQRLQARPERLDDAALRLLLGVVIRGRDRLSLSLEQCLADVAGEELVSREPALAFRFYDCVCERMPAWNYARLKAADLALQRGELERCQAHLEGSNEEQRQLPWLLDIAARLALAQGDVAAALEAWRQAITAARQETQLVELFRQRAREARRGPGVLQARSLLNRGERDAAIALLEALLEQDPQWQPLRSLLEQARGPRATPSGVAGEGVELEGEKEEVERLERKLQQLALRAGRAWPAEVESAASEAADPPTAAGFERFVQMALGRLALLG